MDLRRLHALRARPVRDHEARRRAAALRRRLSSRGFDQRRRDRDRHPRPSQRNRPGHREVEGRHRVQGHDGGQLLQAVRERPGRDRNRLRQHDREGQRQRPVRGAAQRDRPVTGHPAGDAGRGRLPLSFRLITRTGPP
ncbi:Uncharacterised protein [Clostridium sporogenes]|nr:Uncharacterised protein [Clostridium sporogenes]